MTAVPKIKINILTGFLGSGKTTLLNRLLNAGSFADTAVVVNELGEIGLDHLLVTERAGQIALLEGGCLCCAVIDSLPETLLELYRMRAAGEVPEFSRIIIETTGLADPGPIVESLRRNPLLSHFFEAGVTITALDMLTAAEVPVRHPEALRQVVLADRIVLTKLDLRGSPTPNEDVVLRALNPVAEVVTAAEVEAVPGRLIAPAAFLRGDVEAPPAAQHTHGVSAWSFPVEAPVTQAGLAAFSMALNLILGPALLRCKGVVQTARGAVIIQGVGTRFSFVDAEGQAAGVPPHVTCIVEKRDRDAIVPLLRWLHVPEGTLPPTLEELP